MKRGKLTLECSCGNTKKWTILANMLESTKLYYEYEYKIQCVECNATKTFAKAPVSLGRLQ